MAANQIELMQVKRSRDIEECVDELEREFNLRSRCYIRWVAEGRMSNTDAQDRLDRQFSAIAHLRQCQEMLEKSQNPVRPTPPVPVQVQ